MGLSAESNKIMCLTCDCNTQIIIAYYDYMIYMHTYIYIGHFSLTAFFYCSLYEESAENLHQLSDKLPAPGNTITVLDHLYLLRFMNER